MNLYRIFAASISALMLAGCAHPIHISSNGTQLDRLSIAAPHIAANVGYYISPTAKSTEVTTSGGGGDNVRYFPYRDIETGFQKILSNVFSSATKLESIAALSEVTLSSIDYIIVPDLVTTSGGSGFFTWPPTSFTVDLTSNIRDKEGKMITSLRVVGVGSAETSERLYEHGIAGRRAMEDALLKMQASLLEFGFTTGKREPRPAALQDPSSASSRLAEIKELRDKGQISQEEYESKRKTILQSL